MNRMRSGISNGHLTESKEDMDTGTVGHWTRGLHPSHKVEEDLGNMSGVTPKGANWQPDLSDTQKSMPLMKAVPLVPNIPVSQAVLALEQTAVPECISIENGESHQGSIFSVNCSGAEEGPSTKVSCIY